MEGEVILTIRVENKDIEHIIYNPKHIPNNGESICFVYDKEDNDIPDSYVVDFVDYEYHIYDNSVHILILAI